MLEDKIEVLEEKIKMAKELGMSDWAEMRQSQLTEIKQITGLSFKPVDQAYIEKAIRKWYWEPTGGNFVALALGIGVSLVIIGAALDPRGAQPPPQFKLWATLGAAMFQIFNFGACAWHQCECKTKPIEEWTDNLPRGAMLAMKEAKDQKIGNFQIYYPTKEDVRVKTDPIIVGFKEVEPSYSYSRSAKWGKVMLKIHEWDDGKIYEENK